MREERGEMGRLLFRHGNSFSSKAIISIHSMNETNITTKWLIQPWIQAKARKKQASKQFPEWQCCLTRVFFLLVPIGFRYICFPSEIHENQCQYERKSGKLFVARVNQNSYTFDWILISIFDQMVVITLTGCIDNEMCMHFGWTITSCIVHSAHTHIQIEGIFILRWQFLSSN